MVNGKEEDVSNRCRELRDGVIFNWGIYDSYFFNLNWKRCMIFLVGFGEERFGELEKVRCSRKIRWLCGFVF